MPDLSRRGSGLEKRAAARAALNSVEDGMVLGLGTGSTVRYLLDAIAEQRAQGRLRNLVGIPTSVATMEQAQRLGIPLAGQGYAGPVHLAIDGADEVDTDLRLIKGMGGALLREKVVAEAAGRFLVVVDSSKIVRQLGSVSPLPVEVDPFSAPFQRAFLERLGCSPALRTNDSGSPAVSDGGHWIYDCSFADGIAAPEELASALDGRAGIVAHGLFLGLTDLVLVGVEDAVREMTAASRGRGPA